MPQVKAGKLRALAVTTAKRTAAAPELPTLAESGLKDLDVPSWYGALVPIQTPKGIVEQIQQGIAQIVSSGEVKALLEGQGLYPLANRPEEFAAQIKRETAVWARVIREAGIKAE
jgi:tripartite-type tricarboxylate transporter receptor subunit TctC